eukprot:scaffold271350_cov29-Prasinocladus_malaysianus.AAC.1
MARSSIPGLWSGVLPMPWGCPEPRVGMAWPAPTHQQRALGSQSRLAGRVSFRQPLSLAPSWCRRETVQAWPTTSQPQESYNNRWN